MANQEWLTGSDLGEFDEGTIFVQNPEGRTDVVCKTIEYRPSENIIDDIEYRTLKPIIISSNLPSKDVKTNYDGMSLYISPNENLVYLLGTFPIITNDEEYYFTLRLKEVDTNNINNVRTVTDKCFKIKNKNKPQTWKSNYNNIINCYNNSYFITKLSDKILNYDKTETFIRVSGEMPSGLVLENDGTISGYPIYTNKTDYEIYIQIFSNNKLIETLNTDIIPDINNPLNIKYGKKFIIKVNETTISETPQWISEENIGNVDSGKTSNLQILSIINDSTDNITYEYNDADKEKFSHIGLTLEPTGKITGICKTKQSTTWDFNAVAVYKPYDSTTLQLSETKKFVVSTNMSSSIHKIDWVDDGYNLGEYIIGNNISLNIPKAYVNDGSDISYSFIGEHPLGLNITKDGNIYGNIEYQTDGEKIFEIMAATPYRYISRKFIIKLKKGLSYNSIKLYLKINNEYKKEYNNIQNQLDSTKEYKIYNNNYKVSVFPKIDVATLKCYDREVLASMLNFGNPEIIRFGLSECISVVSTDIYDVIYKSIDENTYQWDDINCGDFNFEEELETRKNLDITNPLKLEDDAKIDFNNEIYKTNVKQLVWDEDYGMMVEKEFKTTPSDSYNVFNFKLVRNLLSTPIYVKQLNGTYYYDLGSQEIYGKIDDIELEGDNIGIIKNPWCYNRIKNKFILDNIDENADMALPNITDDDVEYDSNGNSYITFLDTNIEPLPEWKRKQPLNWKANTTYKLNDIILYDFIYYRVIQQFTTGNIFNYDENTLEIIDINDANKYLTKNFFPSLDIGYYNYSSVKNDLGNLNEEEKNGYYWYGKTFTFWELVAEPLYNKNIESFGIPFYSNKNRLDDKIPSVKDITLTMKVFPADANVTIIYDGIEYTDGQHHEGYSRIGNEYILTTKPGKRLIWSVEKENYFTQSGNYILVTDEYNTINLLKKCLITVNSTDIYGNKIDASITLDPENENDYYERIYKNEIYKAINVNTLDGYIESGKYYICYSNPYEIYDNGIVYNRIYKFINNEPIEQYYTVNNTNYFYYCICVLNNNSEDEYFIVLPDFCSLKIIPEPSDSEVVLQSNGYEQKNNLIGVLKGETVSYVVSKIGYNTESGEIQHLNENTILDINLTEPGIDVTDYEYRINSSTNDAVLTKYIGMNDVVTLPNI